MKREDLKVLGLTDEQIEKVMAENGKDIEAAKASLKTAETNAEQFKTQLEELATTLKAKPEELKSKITELLTTVATASEEHARQLAQVKLDAAVDMTLTKAGAVNLKAVKALLDPSKISLGDKGAITGLDEQITAIKSTDAWAFTTTQSTAPPPKSGERHGGGGGTEKSLDEEIMDRLGAGSGKE